MGRARILVAVLALTLVAACTGSSPSTGPSSGAPAPKTSAAPVTVTYAIDQEFNSYNNNTPDAASTANSVVLNQILRGFWFATPLGQIQNDTEFGTFSRVSASPLTVKYTFNPKAVWSDGNPIDCDDAVLAWAANSGRWPTGRRNPDTGARITAFSSIRPGEWSNVERPVCADGDKSFTVTYDTVFADWQSLFGPGTILPAHIVEKRSGVKDIVAAVKTNKTATMIKIGNVYNTLWAMAPGKYKTDVSPSAGPYQVASWAADQSMTLKPNPAWWGTPPKASTVVIKYVREDLQVAALMAGKVDVIDPTPSKDVSAQLAVAGSAVQVATSDSFSWEHLDFNFRTAFKSADLRKAFAMCVPRQQIVDELVKPQNPSATILQSRFLLPFQPGYAKVSGTAGAAYDTVDIAGARQILQDKHKTGLRVRLGYQFPSPRRKAEFDLIKASCDQAGFRIVDGGDGSFLGHALLKGDFDVALFAWSGSPRVTQAYNTYITKGGGNHGRYSSKEVDTLLKQLYSELNPTVQQNLMAQLDATLWKDVATIPLFAFPAVVATSKGMQGVQYNPNQAGITFDVNQWTRS